MAVQHTLLKVLGTYTPDPPKRRVISNRGYNVNRNPKRKTRLTDHQALEARWLVEFGGWTWQMAIEHYGISYGYARSLFVYQTRSKIYPKAGDFPSGYCPEKR